MKIEMTYDQYYLLLRYEWDALRPHFTKDATLNELVNPTQMLQMYNRRVPAHIAVDIVSDVHKGDAFEDAFNAVVEYAL